MEEAKETEIMSGMITGIHHVALKCKGTEEFEKAVHFYRDILKLEVARTWGEETEAGAMLDTGSGLIEIFADALDQKEEGAVRHFALETNDVDGCVMAVKAAGYEVFVEPKDIVIPSNPPYPARIAFCFGPVGEQIEFFHVL